MRTVKIEKWFLFLPDSFVEKIYLFYLWASYPTFFSWHNTLFEWCLKVDEKWIDWPFMSRFKPLNVEELKMQRKLNVQRLKPCFELLGIRTRDIVTGLVGVVTSVSFDLTGCVQVLLNPGVDNENKTGDPHWIDTVRLDPEMRERVIDLKKFFVDGSGGPADDFKSGIPVGSTGDLPDGPTHKPIK